MKVVETGLKRYLYPNQDLPHIQSIMTIKHANTVENVCFYIKSPNSIHFE